VFFQLKHKSGHFTPVEATMTAMKNNDSNRVEKLFFSFRPLTITPLQVQAHHERTYRLSQLAYENVCKKKRKF